MNWPVVPLGGLLTSTLGGVWGQPPGDDDVDVGVWRVTELREHGRLEPQSAAHRSISAKQLASRALQRGDLLLEKSGGGPNTPVGRVGLVGDVPGHAVCSNFMQLMRPDASKVHPRFLHLYLNHFHDMGGTLPMQVATTNIRNIKASQYLALDIPMPSLGEQRSIVEFLEGHLSRLDAAAHNLSTASRRLELLDSRLLDEYFSGGDSVPLDELVTDISAGKSFGAASAPAAADEWGIIKVSAMTWGEFNGEENKAVLASKVDPRFEIRQGDLLVSRANTSDYVGASVLVGPVRPRLLLSDKSLRLTPACGVDPTWLWRALQAPSARRQISELATGTKDSMRNISQASLRRVMLPRPHEWLQFQALDAYENCSSATKALRRELTRSEAHLKRLRRSLLTAAFAGRLTRDRQYLDTAELVSP